MSKQKKGPGRPVTTGTMRPNVIGVRFSDEEREQIETKATEADESMSMWMRRVVLKAANR